MRLSKSEINRIKTAARDVWGDKAIVFLYGSRTDDLNKGGDIDLFIKLSNEPDPKEIMLQKSEFLAKLDFLLGEQKIDVMVETRYNRQLPIIKSAQANGIKL